MCALRQVPREEVEERLHLYIEGLRSNAICEIQPSSVDVEGYRTFLVSGSLTDLTRLLISFRIAFAATPVVAVLKSI